MILPSYEAIVAQRKTRGNWSRKECVALGIPFPPPTGWLNFHFEQPEGQCVIPLTRGLVAKVDAADFAELAQFYWRAFKSSRPGCRPYFAAARPAVVNGKPGYLSMARHLLRPSEGVEPDHINGDPLDNRRENLRFATPSENKRNRRAFINKQVPLKGVQQKGRCWAAHIQIDGTTIFLGSFSTAVEAAKAYDEGAIRYHGEFARLNFPALVPAGEG